MVKMAGDAPHGGAWSVERLRAAPFWRARRGAALVSMRHDDLELNPGLGREPEGGLIPAAVLVPLILRPGGMTILLTRRADHLDDHAGQISFPGGRVEAADASVEETALREAHEELALARERVELMGRLDDYETGTGFCVSPVVGAVLPPLALEPDPREVAEFFEVPVEIVLDPSHHESYGHKKNGIVRRYHAIRHDGRLIWGVTAGILISLYEVLREA